MFKVLGGFDAKSYNSIQIWYNVLGFEHSGWVNSLQSGVAFLYPLKIFWCFQGV